MCGTYNFRCGTVDALKLSGEWNVPKFRLSTGNERKRKFPPQPPAPLCTRILTVLADVEFYFNRYYVGIKSSNHAAKVWNWWMWQFIISPIENILWVNEAILVWSFIIKLYNKIYLSHQYGRSGNIPTSHDIAFEILGWSPILIVFTLDVAWHWRSDYY